MFDRYELQALKSQLLQKFTEESYAKRAADQIAAMVGESATMWKHFGPYWPLAQALLLQYQPEQASIWRAWGEPPAILAHYDTGDEMLNAIAAMLHLGQDGDYLRPTGSPHPIHLEDGSKALYMPGVGLVD